MRVKIGLDPLRGNKLEVQARLEVQALAGCEGLRFGLLGPNISADDVGMPSPPTAIHIQGRPGAAGSLELTLEERFIAGDLMTWNLKLWTPEPITWLFVYPVEGTHISFLSWRFLMEDKYGIFSNDLFEAAPLEVDLRHDAPFLHYDYSWRELDDSCICDPPIAFVDLEPNRGYGIQWRRNMGIESFGTGSPV